MDTVIIFVHVTSFNKFESNFVNQISWKQDSTQPKSSAKPQARKPKHAEKALIMSFTLSSGVFFVGLYQIFFKRDHFGVDLDWYRFRRDWMGNKIMKRPRSHL